MQVLGRLQAALVEVLSPFNEYSRGALLSLVKYKAIWRVDPQFSDAPEYTFW